MKDRVWQFALETLVILAGIVMLLGAAMLGGCEQNSCSTGTCPVVVDNQWEQWQHMRWESYTVLKKFQPTAEKPYYRLRVRFRDKEVEWQVSLERWRLMYEGQTVWFPTWPATLE